MDQRWIKYLYEFHVTRDYYACHDYLEDWWFDIGNPQNHPLMGFIQFAVALYHYRADNLKGARLLLDKASHIFELNKEHLGEYELDIEHLFNVINDLKLDVYHQRAFRDINLKVINENIINTLNDWAKQKGYVLYQASDMSNLHLIHKHKFKHR